MRHVFKKKTLLVLVAGPCGGDLSEDGVQDVSDVLVMLQVYGSVYPVRLLAAHPACAAQISGHST